jgi:hypothetical protein
MASGGLSNLLGIRVGVIGGIYISVAIPAKR